MGRWFGIAVVAALLAGGGIASAQPAFPSKPVHIFVPYVAGGAVDILTRTLGDVVSRQWGQTVVVENRPGAGGVIGADSVAKSAPDGYTLLMGAIATHAINPSLMPSLPYDADFTPPAKPDPKKQLPISRQNFVDLCGELTHIDEQAFESMWRTVGLSVDWEHLYTTISEDSRRTSQRACWNASAARGSPSPSASLAPRAWRCRPTRNSRRP